MSTWWGRREASKGRDSIIFKSFQRRKDIGQNGGTLILFPFPPQQNAATSLEVARPVVAVAGAAAQEPLEGLPELRAEDCVDDRVQGRVEVAQPQEETDMVA